ncbi:DNA polymerase IV [Paraoerskovia sediminicola]|uniref:DNA polymerase IV n=1 Tax=Paraoerskovia sediminicola TaxID=1138587 RepID=A0ABN6XF76_9CELL|nr:DNA polymerase IV [Paraoerskovia sediminicola]BDZ43419.1 DNA polymerase IV [Paraoerskovia sediminicola]
MDHDLLADAARQRSRPTILHADADSFFAAVEQRDKPSLRGKPVLVGGTGGRGVVSTASYEARVSGARSAMPMSRARRLAPAAAVLSPRFEAYSAYSRVIMRELGTLSELLEPLSIDEAFVDLDAGPHADDPAAAAVAVRARIRERTGLAVSIGAGRSKLVAKIASDAAKPDGLLVVAPEDEDEFLLPLPVRAIPGVGPATSAALERIDVRTVADLRRQDPDVLAETVGESAGVSLYRLSRGVDLRPVAPSGERKSVGAERTFAADIFGDATIRAAVDTVADEALGRLETHGGGARTVVAKVRFADFTTVTRSVTLTHPSGDPATLREAAHQAAHAAGITDSVRLLGVSFHNLSPHAQLTLDWDGDRTPGAAGAPAAATPSDDVPRFSPSPRAAGRAGPRLLDEAGSRPGLDVEHPTLGRGWVVHVRGREATVRFETVDTPPARSRVVDLDTDPLTIVPPLAAIVLEEDEGA